jgi:predicted porin
MTFNKKVLAGLVAFAAASTSAQAATLVAEDGWEVKIGGMINQFVTFTNDDNGDDVNEVRDGLLPAFLNFDFKAPTMNGLDIAAHISISPGTNSDSYNAQEQREVYFTVDGSFGQILAGKALGLYGSHNILTDQTLWGVGYGTTGNLNTTLGGIGLGYDYAAWRSQVRWTSPDMNGFKVAFSVNDNGGSAISLAGGKPTGGVVTGAQDSEDLRYEGDISYAGAFDGGNYKLWLSAMHQGDDRANAADAAEDEQAWTVGGTLSVNNFEFMAQYSDSEGDLGGLDSEWNQFIVQGGYRFGGTTLVSASYAELEDDSSNAVRTARYGDASDDTIERLTVGVYHDVNANLKLVAEYTKVEDDNSDVVDLDIFSIGGFVFF